MSDPCIALTDRDREEAHAFFVLMRAVKPNVRRTELNEADREAFEVAGKLGEIIVGRALALRVDWTVSMEAGDHRVDFTLPDGRTVDVKAVAVTANPHYDFCLTFGEGEFRADIAALVLIAPDQGCGWLAGAITRQEFETLATLQIEWGHRGVVCPWVLRRSQLRPWCEVVGGGAWK